MRSLMTVTSRPYSSEVTITRPANTTAYTAGDAIGVADVSVAANAGSAIHELTEIGPAGGLILMLSMDLMPYVASVPAGMSSFTAHLFNAAPTAILDNAAYSLQAADRTKYLGSIAIGTPAVTNMGVTPTTIYASSDKTTHQGTWQLASGSTSLWVVLVTAGGYTPSSGAVKLLRAFASAV
jgi:hypothetical protein